MNLPPIPDLRLLTWAGVRDRTCTRCGATKTCDHFHLSKGPRAYYRNSVCLQCVTQKLEKWKSDNPDQYEAAHKRWHIENRNRVNAKSRERNPEKKRAIRAAWKKRNPDNANANWHRRRARKLNAPINDFTVAEWEVIKTDQQGRCYYCEKERTLTQDHKLPLSRGGSHTKSNIVGACADCNCRKHTKTAEEFLREAA